MPKSKRRKVNWLLVAAVAVPVMLAGVSGAVYFGYKYLNRYHAAANAKKLKEWPDPPPEQFTPVPPAPGLPVLLTPDQLRTLPQPPVPPQPSSDSNVPLPPLVQSFAANPSPSNRPLDPIVYLEAPKYEVRGIGSPVLGLLRRELYRQGLLLAAGNELGLAPRDEVLGDLPPHDLADGNRLRLAMSLVPNRQPREVSVYAGREPVSPVWTAKSDPIGRNERPLEALKQAEELSRVGYVTALKAAGLSGRANPIQLAVAVPPEVERLLQQVTFTAQYDAVRRLHRVVRESGESPATLSALVRGYAMLGLLTDRQWGGLTWVFKARSLLYAERLRQRADTDPWGYWSRGYALALAGAHRDALNDLAEAEKRRGTWETPKWVALTEHLARFDTAKLNESVSGTWGDTARLFHFLTVESFHSPILTHTAGRAVVARVPDCYLVHDALASVGGVSLLHRSTVEGWAAFDETFSKRVLDLYGLPQPVTDLINDRSDEPMVVTALVAAGRSRQDTSGLSWAVVGRFAREARFVQAEARLHFMRYMWSVPVTDEFLAMRPLVKDHPQYPFLETYAIDTQQDPAEYVRRVKGTEPPELSHRHRHLLDAWLRVDDRAVVDVAITAGKHGDDLYTDTHLSLRWETQTRRNGGGDRMTYHVQHPDAPVIKAHTVKMAGILKLPEEQLARWGAEAQHPDVFVELSHHARVKEKGDDVERYLRRAIELSPESFTFQLLADAYKKSGKTERWLATMEECLKQPDAGLDHARIRVDIANHYMGLNDYKSAWPYAEKAAQSWAQWAMQCAARCAEGNGDMKNAELWIRRTSERYPSSFHAWYFWCVRTGKGDRAEAQALFEASARALGDLRTTGDLYRVATFYATVGKVDRAIVVFRKIHELEKHPFYLHLSAVLYDALGDKTLRDQVLDQLAKGNKAGGLYDLLNKHLRAEKAPTVDEVADALKKFDDDNRINVTYFLGRILMTRNEPERAGELFKQITKDTSMPNAITPVLAGHALHEGRKQD